MSVVYLLCGLPGSGKTTYAKNLEKDGAVRLTLDEELFALFGREFPRDAYPGHEQKTKSALLERLVGYLSEDRDVVLDWGFWRQEERKRIATFVCEHGGESNLLYFKRNIEQLKDAIRGRDLSKNHEIDNDMLEEFSQRFEEPSGENEIIL